MLEAYLPPPVDAAEVERRSTRRSRRPAPRSAKDLGRVMKAVMGRLAGQTVDGKVVNELVRTKARRLKNTRKPFSRDARLKILKGTHKPLIHPPLRPLSKDRGLFLYPAGSFG